MSVPAYSDPLTVKHVTLILVSAMRGDGTSADPARVVNWYYAPDGELMACHDPINGAPDAYFVTPGAAAIVPAPSAEAR